MGRWSTVRSVPVATEDQMLTTHPATRHTNELCDVQTTNNYFSRNLIFLAVDGGNKTRLQCNVCYLMLGKGGGGGGMWVVGPIPSPQADKLSVTMITRQSSHKHCHPCTLCLYFTSCTLYYLSARPIMRIAAMN